MQAIGRSLIMRPKAILMDEPSTGLAPIIVREIFGVIKRMKEDGNTILLVEQNARMALKICDRAYVMQLGRITLEGDVKTLFETEDIKKLYLGS